jgi:hypothetical protein
VGENLAVGSSSRRRSAVSPAAWDFRPNYSAASPVAPDFRPNCPAANPAARRKTNQNIGSLCAGKIWSGVGWFGLGSGLGPNLGPNLRPNWASHPWDNKTQITFARKL